jgi:hypothetical protein
MCFPLFWHAGIRRALVGLWVHLLLSNHAPNVVFAYGLVERAYSLAKDISLNYSERFPVWTNA